MDTTYIKITSLRTCFTMDVEWLVELERVADGDPLVLQETVSRDVRERVTCVIVRNNIGRTLPDIFAGLPKLKKIMISCRHVRNISVLLKYKITGLTISHFDLDIELRTISNMVHLTVLRIGRIYNDTVQNLTSLERLYITECNAEVLYSLPSSLVTLVVNNNVTGDVDIDRININRNMKCIVWHNVRDLSFLTKFPSLTSLTVSVERDIDMRAISTLRQLESLKLTYTHFGTVILPAVDLPKLETLEISNAILYNLEVLRGLPALYSLFLINCEVNDPTVIWESKTLIELAFDNCRLKRLEGVVALKHSLKYLSLKSCRLGPDTNNVTYISELKKLEILRLTDTDIVDISFIDALPNLKHVMLPRTLTNGIHCLFRIDYVSYIHDIDIKTHEDGFVTLIHRRDSGVETGEQFRQLVKDIDYADESAGQFIKKL